jgi:hypothetical protein
MQRGRGWCGLPKAAAVALDSGAMEVAEKGGKGGREGGRKGARTDGAAASSSERGSLEE